MWPLTFDIGIVSRICMDIAALSGEIERYMEMLKTETLEYCSIEAVVVWWVDIG